MEPVKNVVLGLEDVTIGAPPGRDEEILPLPAAMGMHYTGMPLIVSRWEPTPDEREIIARGGDVYLTLFTGVMVPVMVTTYQPIATALHPDRGPIYILTPDHPDYVPLAGTARRRHAGMD